MAHNRFAGRNVIGAGILAAALIAVGFGAGAVVAGEGAPGPGQVPDPTELRKVKAEAMTTPSPAAGPAARIAAKAAPKQRKPALVYLETEPQTLAAGSTGFRIGDCPPRAKAINGYYYVNGTQTSFGLDAQGDSPIRGLRQWAFYLLNEGAPSNVTFGLVCLKNVK